MFKDGGFHSANVTVAISTAQDNLVMVATANSYSVAALTKTNAQIVATNAALANQLENAMATIKKLAANPAATVVEAAVEVAEEIKNGVLWTSSFIRDIVGVVGGRCVLATPEKYVCVKRQATKKVNADQHNGRK